MRPFGVLLIAVFITSSFAAISVLDLDQNVNIIGTEINSIWSYNGSAVISCKKALISVDLENWNITNYSSFSSDFYERIGFIYNGMLFMRSNQKQSNLYAFNFTTLEPITSRNISLSSYGIITTAVVNGQFAYLTTANLSSAFLIKYHLENQAVVSSVALGANATTSVFYSNSVYVTNPLAIFQYFASNLTMAGITIIDSGTVLSAEQNAVGRLAFYTYADHIIKVDLRTSVSISGSIICTQNSFVFMNATYGYCVSNNGTELVTILLSNLTVVSSTTLSYLGRGYGPGMAYNGIIYYGSMDPFAANIIKMDIETMEASVQLGLLPTNYNPWAGVYGENYAYFGSYSTPPTLVKYDTVSGTVVDRVLIPNEFGMIDGIYHAGRLYMAAENPYSEDWNPSIYVFQASTLQLVSKLGFSGFFSIVSAIKYNNFGYFILGDATNYNYMAIIDLDQLKQISIVSMQVHGVDFGSIYGNNIFCANQYGTYSYSIEPLEVSKILALYDTNKCVGSGAYIYCTSGTRISQIDQNTFTVLNNITFKKNTATEIAVGTVLYVTENSRLVHMIDISGTNFSYIKNLTIPLLATSAFSDGKKIYFGAGNGGVFSMDILNGTGGTSTTGTTGVIATSTTGTSTTTTTTSADSNQSTDSNTSTNKPVLIGAIVGVIAGIVLVTVIIVFLVLRKRKRDQPDSSIPLGPRSTLTNNNMQQITNIKKLEKVGGGNFGNVYRGLWQETTEVALKMLKSEAAEEFVREASLLSTLNHPNCVHFYGIWREDNEQYIVTEFMSEGALNTYVRSHQDTLTENELIEMAFQIAVGMQYLTEKNNIIHRDLSLRNLLVTKQAGKIVVKVSDFGMSRETEKNYYKSDDSNKPIRWCAPEVLNYNISDMKTDVYAFGITLWELFSFGKLPYVELDNRTVIKEVLLGLRPDIPKECPLEMYEIMQQCWKENSKERPTFSELVDMLMKLRPRNSTTIAKSVPEEEDGYVPLYNNT